MTALQQKQIEELLETVFTEREQGRDDAGAVLAHAGSHASGLGTAALRDLEGSGLLKLAADRVELTPEGEKRARDVIRRHRLTERLFRDILQLSDDATESQACEMEHIHSPEATGAARRGLEGR